MGFKQVKRKIRRPFEVGACLFLFTLVRFLPFKGVRFLARVFGAILYLIPSQRKLAIANLDTAFPDKTSVEKKKIARRSMANLVMTFMEQIWFNGHEKRQAKYLSFSPEIQQQLSSLEQDNRPVLFLALHMGNWEFTSLSLKRYSDRRLCVVANKVKNAWLNDWIIKAREFTGVKVLLGEGAVKGLLKALRNKENVGLLVDQNTKTRNGGIFGDFFGLPVTISRTPAMLSRKFKARTVIMSCLRTKDGFDYDLRVLPQQPEDFSDDESLSQEFLTQMEAEVRKRPQSWIWMYKRWNYIPSDQLHLQDKYPYYAKIDNT